MRGRNIAHRFTLQTLHVQGEIDAVCFDSCRRAKFRITVRKTAVWCVSGDRDDIWPGAEKNIKKCSPFFLGIRQLLPQCTHHGFDLFMVIIDRCTDLGYGAYTVRPGHLDQLLLIGTGKQKNGSSQHKQNNGQNRTDQERTHANAAAFHMLSSVRRSLIGLMP